MRSIFPRDPISGKVIWWFADEPEKTYNGLFQYTLGTGCLIKSENTPRAARLAGVNVHRGPHYAEIHAVLDRDTLVCIKKAQVIEVLANGECSLLGAVGFIGTSGAWTAGRKIRSACMVLPNKGNIFADPEWFNKPSFRRRAVDGNKTRKKISAIDAEFEISAVRDEEIEFAVFYENPRSIEEAYDDICWLWEFIQFITTKQIPVVSVGFYADSESVISLMWSDYGVDEYILPFQARSLFLVGPPTDIEKLPIDKWFKARSEWKYLLETLNYCVSSKIAPSVYRIFLLVATLEGLHTSLHRRSTSPLKSVLEKIKEVVRESDLSDGDKEMLQMNIKNMGSFTLQERFDDIAKWEILNCKVDEHDFKISNEEVFKILKRIRNEIAHHLPRKVSGKYSEWQLAAICDYIALVIYCVLYQHWNIWMPGPINNPPLAVVSKFNWRYSREMDEMLGLGQSGS